MKTIPFDINKVKVGDIVVNREGRELKILALDCPYEALLDELVNLPIVAMDLKIGRLYHYRPDGQYLYDVEGPEDLLIPVKTKKMWIAVCKRNFEGDFLDKEQGIRQSSSLYSARSDIPNRFDPELHDFIEIEVPDYD